MFEGNLREFVYDGPPTPTRDEMDKNDDISGGKDPSLGERHCPLGRR